MIENTRETALIYIKESLPEWAYEKYSRYFNKWSDSHLNTVVRLLNLEGGANKLLTMLHDKYRDCTIEMLSNEGDVIKRFNSNTVPKKEDGIISFEDADTGKQMQVIGNVIITYKE